MTRSTILGIFFFLMGAMAFLVGLGATPVDKTLLLGGFLASVLGAYFIAPAETKVAATAFVAQVGVYLPKAGGSRPADPPAPPAEKDTP